MSSAPRVCFGPAWCFFTGCLMATSPMRGWLVFATGELTLWWEDLTRAEAEGHLHWGFKYSPSSDASRDLGFRASRGPMGTSDIQSAEHLRFDVPRRSNATLSRAPAIGLKRKVRPLFVPFVFSRIYFSFLVD